MSEEQKKSNSLTKIFAKTAVAAGISGGLMAGVLALAGHDAGMSLSLGTYFGAVVAGVYFAGCVTIESRKARREMELPDHSSCCGKKDDAPKPE